MQALSTFQQQPSGDYPTVRVFPPAPPVQGHPRADYPQTYHLVTILLQPKVSPHPAYGYPCATCWKS